MEQERPTEVQPGVPVSLSRDQVRERLRAVALFQGLGESDLEQILGISESVLVEAGEYVFKEGDRGDHFFIIVHGRIELRKASGNASKKLAVLRTGQAFGEMSLLNQTPRSASAFALEDTYMLSVSRAAFSQILGGDTLAVRLLRNLSRALWATSVRLAAKQSQQRDPDKPHEALADFNRLLRTRLLPRLTPRVSGYDLSASTLAPREGMGASVWDWFLLADGRPAFLVMKSTRIDIFSAQRLAALRSILRTVAMEPQVTLGALLTAASHGLRSGWVDGLSGPVACGLVALSDGAAEWVGGGQVGGMVVRAAGAVEDLAEEAPAVGARPGHAYASATVTLGPGDKVIFLTERSPSSTRIVTSVIGGGYTSSARDALNKLFGGLGEAAGGRAALADLTGAVITRSRPEVRSREERDGGY